jgi:hypothetical protein
MRDKKSVDLDQDSSLESNKKSTVDQSKGNEGFDSEINQDISYYAEKEGHVLSTLDKLCKKYTLDVDNITKVKPEDLKRTFDDYINTLEEKILMGRESDDCNEMNSNCNKFESQVVELSDLCVKNGMNKEEMAEVSNSLLVANTKKSAKGKEKAIWDNFFIIDFLNADFYHFYTVLVKLWLGEHIKKSELEPIMSCKVMILRSLIKRKFGEEIDMR